MRVQCTVAYKELSIKQEKNNKNERMKISEQKTKHNKRVPKLVGQECNIMRRCNFCRCYIGVLRSKCPPIVVPHLNRDGEWNGTGASVKTRCMMHNMVEKIAP
jgi:hypothetical protein